MKRAILSLILISLFQFSIAQNILSPNWVKTKGSPVAGETQGWGVNVDTDGNIYWPINVDSTGQGLDIVCYKYDANGNALWTTPFYFGGTGSQQAYVCNVKDSFLYIGGRYCPIQGFSCDMVLLKIDKQTKNLDWSRTQDFGNNGYDEIDGLAIRSDGIYCGGWGQAIQTGPYQIDMGLWKVNFDGSTAWINSLGKSNTAEHLDGHFVVDDSTIYAAGLWGGGGLANLYNGHSFLGKFSKTDGSLKDSVLYGNPSSVALDIENALGMTTDGTYLYTTGYTILPNATDWQIFIAKFDKNLNQIWYRTWGGTGNETARGIAVSGSKLFIAGLSESSSFAPGGRSDAILLEYDIAGNYITYESWGDHLDNSFRDIAIYDNNIYLSGTSSFANSTGDSAFILKKSFSYPTHVSDSQFENGGVIIFPNPSTNGKATLRIHNDKNTSHTFRLFDILGKQVFSHDFKSADFSFSYPERNQLYFYTIETKESIIAKGKLVSR